MVGVYMKRDIKIAFYNKLKNMIVYLNQMKVKVPKEQGNNFVILILTLTFFKSLPKHSYQKDEKVEVIKDIETARVAKPDAQPAVSPVIVTADEDNRLLYVVISAMSAAVLMTAVGVYFRKNLTFLRNSD